MSRIGKNPVVWPAGLKVTVEGGTFHAKGAKGEIRIPIPSAVKVIASESDKKILVQAADGSKGARMTQGTLRSLVANAVKGVTAGYERRLQIVGVGYAAKVQGKELSLSIGFCSPQVKQIPEGIKVELPNPTLLVIRGADKQQVGDFASAIRRIRPPEPYQGKGIRYEDEVVKKKAGKTAVGVGGT